MTSKRWTVLDAQATVLSHTRQVQQHYEAGGAFDQGADGGAVELRPDQPAGRALEDLIILLTGARRPDHPAGRALEDLISLLDGRLEDLIILLTGARSPDQEVKRFTALVVPRHAD